MRLYALPCLLNLTQQDSIVQTLSQEHPNKIVDIMTSALNAVPFVGEYVVDAASGRVS